MTNWSTALVTGASSGIGRDLALSLAKRGTKVFAAARRKQQLDALVAEIAAAGGRAEAIAMDVRDSDATYEAVRALDEREPLELVIANAGIGDRTKATRFDWPRAKQLVEVNLLGAMATIAGALPGMVARNRGHLCGVASVAAFRGMPTYSAYGASKAGLVSFLESTRIDLRKKKLDVHVTTVCPGYVETEMTVGLKSKLMITSEEAVAHILKALDAGESLAAFPARVTVPLRALALLPNSMFDYILSRVKA
jgi:short-subunit dehydrogenase